MELKHKIVLGLGTAVILWLVEFRMLEVITVCAISLITIAVYKYLTLRNNSDDPRYIYPSKLDWLENKKIAEDATLKLRDIFETLGKMLTMEEFDEDLQVELSLAYPNYMTVLQTAKDDLLRKDCSIVIAGATSSGKSSLLNTLVGRKLFPVSNVASAGKVCRVRNSEVLCVKTFDRKDKLVKVEKVASEDKLTELMINYFDKSKRSAETDKIFYVDVHLPVDILKGNIIIVDTPGIGETDEVDQLLIDFLPSALSMIFMVDASNAGGIQKDRLLKIFHEVLKNLDTMPCFDPREVIFVTNKWDNVQTEDTIGVNEHEKTWNTIMELLKNKWAFLTEENVFRICLNQRKTGGRRFKNELKRFEALLQVTIQRNQNKRIKHHFSFLEDFTQNAERGTLARLHWISLSKRNQQEMIRNNTRNIEVLQDSLQNVRVAFEIDKEEKTTELTDKLHAYLNLEKTKKQIINPEHDIAVSSVGMLSVTDILHARFGKATRDWLDGEEMKKIVAEVDTEMKTFLLEVESRLNEIKTNMIGFQSPLRSNAISDNFMSASVNILPGVPGIFETIAYVYIRIVLGDLFKTNQQRKTQMAEKFWKFILKSLSRSKIHDCFKKSFSLEYEKMIKKIFDIKLKQELDTLVRTNRQLALKQELYRQKQHSYESLHELIEKIERDSKDFIETILSNKF